MELGVGTASAPADRIRKAVATFFMLSGTPDEVKERLWNMLTDSLTGDLLDGEAARRCQLYKQLVELLMTMSVMLDAKPEKS